MNQKGNNSRDKVKEEKARKEGEAYIENEGVRGITRRKRAGQQGEINQLNKMISFETCVIVTTI